MNLAKCFSRDFLSGTEVWPLGWACYRYHSTNPKRSRAYSTPCAPKLSFHAMENTEAQGGKGARAAAPDTGSPHWQGVKAPRPAGVDSAEHAPMRAPWASAAAASAPAPGTVTAAPWAARARHVAASGAAAVSPFGPPSTHASDGWVLESRKGPILSSGLADT